jgi:flagellar hook-length control protein FliK
MPNIQAFSQQSVTSSSDKTGAKSHSKNKSVHSNTLFSNDLRSSFNELVAKQKAQKSLPELDEQAHRQSGNPMPFTNHTLDDLFPSRGLEGNGLEGQAKTDSDLDNIVDRIDAWLAGSSPNEAVKLSQALKGVDLKSLDEATAKMISAQISKLEQQVANADKQQVNANNLFLNELMAKENDLANSKSLLLNRAAGLFNGQQSELNAASHASFNQNKNAIQVNQLNGNTLSQVEIKSTQLLDEKSLTQELNAKFAIQANSIAQGASKVNLSQPRGNSFTQPFIGLASATSANQAVQFQFSDLKKSSDIKNIKLDWESKIANLDGKAKMSNLIDFGTASNSKGGLKQQREGMFNGSAMNPAERVGVGMSKPMSQYLQANSPGQVATGQTETQSSQNISQQMLRTDIKLPTNHPQWDKAFNQRIVMMQKQQHQLAEIRLNPLNMGPIKVSIQKGESDSSIQMWAANSQTRELIEQALPKLKEMLTESGSGEFELEMSEFSKHPHQNQQSEESGEGGKKRHALQSTGIEQETQSELALVANGSSANNRVDTFA